MTTKTLPLRARQALTILALDAIEPLVGEALDAMCAAREAAFRAGLRAEEAETLAEAAPVFTRAAAEARRTADELDAATQKIYGKFGGVLRRRDALNATLEIITTTRAENARWTAYVCERRSTDAAREAYLWA